MLAGELEAEPGVDRAERRPAGLRALAQTLDVLEQPLDLGGREVGVEHEPRARAHERLVPGGAQLIAARGRAAVLPHDRRVQRLARGRIPHAHGLALVGYADRPELPLAHPRVRERLARERVRRLPDLARVVLHPAGPREGLGELAVGGADRLGLLVEHEAPRARRPLVDREDHEPAA